MKAMVLHECDPGLVPLGRRCLKGQTVCRMPDDLLAARIVFTSRRRLFGDGNASGW